MKKKNIESLINQQEKSTILCGLFNRELEWRKWKWGCSLSEVEVGPRYVCKPLQKGIDDKMENEPIRLM